MKRVACDRRFLPQILEILNDAIVTSTALWDYSPRTPAMMEAWFQAKEAGSFPIIGFVDDAERLLAFGSFGTFRAFPAYKYSVEHSVYVRREHRRQGLGIAILRELIEAATDRGFHTLIGAIASENEPSIALHRQCGFEFCGTIRQAGFKFGQWIDVSFYQRILDTPEDPQDG